MKARQLLHGILLLGFSGWGLSGSVWAQAFPGYPTEYIAQAATRYFVYLNGNSPLLLNAIRRYIPAATLQQYGAQTVIQLGIFEDVGAAEEQKQLLETQGFQVEMDAIAPEAYSTLVQPALPVPTTSLPTFTAQPTGFYVVYSEEDSPLNFARVQQIVPNAVRRQVGDRSVIQIGAFESESEAQQWMRGLAAQGIRTRVGLISSGNTAQAPLATSRYLNDSELTHSYTRGYYVVIPSNREALNPLVDRVAQMVGGQVQVQPRIAPFGPHIAVGPLRDRAEAERWSLMIRNSGLRNTRVFFSR